MERKIDYGVVWAASKDIDQAIDLLAKRLAEKAEKGYKLLGGASIAVDDGCFFVSQTITKEANAYD